MKKIFLGSIAILAIAAMAAFNVNLNSQRDELSAISLAKVEALADYEIGPPLTNWKEYTVTCTVTQGIDYIIVYTTSYSYTTTACGYGTGWCLAPAGC